jgi:signal transduction histidine kinase
LAQRRKVSILVLAGVVVLMFVTGWLWYRNLQRKQKLMHTEQQLQQAKINELEKEKQLLAVEAVLRGQETERSRLAKDLHDGLGGILSSAKYIVNDMKEDVIITKENAVAFERITEVLDKSIYELRRISHNMMPESLAKQTLGEGLKDLCNYLSANNILHIDYSDFGMEKKAINAETKVSIYRTVQELLNNIIKHAGATTAIVQLVANENMLSITVEDNGKGFNTADLANVSGIGYKNIGSRIDYLKGKWDVHSEAGKGASVYMEIPLS